MKLSDLGEFGLIERFAGTFLENLPAGTVGIGDDAAVIPWDDGRALLVTTDMLVEGTHFLKDVIAAVDLGAKALAVNLSDIAAMGGKPLSVFLSLGLPPDVEVAWVDDFFAGLWTLAQKHDVSLLGGDTTKSPGGIVVNITALGVANLEHIKKRSAARMGDVVCVTGMLGDSGAGLRVLLEKKARGADEETLVSRHHRPLPHVQEGQWLGARTDVHAMMDVSDGIDSDLRRIMEQSGCGVDVDLDKLPLSAELVRVCAASGWDAQELAAVAGEDYCLLFTADSHEYTRLAEDFLKEFRRPLYMIGAVTGAAGQLHYTRENQLHQFDSRGWDHFRAHI